MAKRCAKCEKTVYPVEEFRCLDKTWHKGCFRCWECGLALNMKNYKGYNKLPYCDAHYPKVKHTAVADTPENARIAQNTKIQSQVQYHQEFERNVKGTKITVADDPETLRAMKNAEISSQIKYHDHASRQMEMEKQRALVDTGDNMPQNMGSGPGKPGSIADYNPAPEVAPPVHHEEPAQPSPYTARNQGQTTVYNAGQRGKVEHTQSKKIGSIADYDPVTDFNRQPQANHYQHQQGYGQRAPQQQHQHQQQYHQSQPQYQPQGSRREPEPYRQPPPAQQQQVHHQPTHHQPSHHQPSHHQPSHHTQPHHQSPAYHHAPPQPQQPVHQPVHQPPQGPKYRAMYDYEAADTDEVSFREGDYIINAESIDEGWMTGTVQRTGQHGMLPANYVEKS